MIWTYPTPFGQFSIRPSDDGRHDLYIGDELLASYDKPEEAAYDVFTQTSGCYEWDSQTATIEHPADLSEWTQSGRVGER
ncbi:hypothetical protein [Methylogaea oryzae]|uniref:Uncharacterized protein n=1 Tax=Methylogaea oryzae TaxID=1295382 RepID=A0A8D4VSS4_9GAMM|nr:hypothetical protein [Methylogaea oryzae]BBL71907.1 hypothetical protein MoryE10_25130 [Methylogaea oryzae]